MLGWDTNAFKQIVFHETRHGKHNCFRKSGIFALVECNMLCRLRENTKLYTQSEQGDSSRCLLPRHLYTCSKHFDGVHYTQRHNIDCMKSNCLQCTRCSGNEISEAFTMSARQDSYYKTFMHFKVKKNKAIPVTGRGGL
jgi:hypothetical protein